MGEIRTNPVEISSVDSQQNFGFVREDSGSILTK